LRAEWALGETAGDIGRGARRAVGATYSSGPLTVGAAYTRSTSVTDIDTDNWTVGAAYKVGEFKVAAGFARNDPNGGSKVDDSWLGGSYSITPAIDLTAAYYRTRADTVTDPRRNMMVVGATYSLSKRTNLYFDIDYTRFAGTGVLAPWGVQRAGNLDSVKAVSVGMNHLF
jgi:predicted porin